MAVAERHGMIGASIFYTDSKVLSLMSDSQSSVSLASLLQQLLTQVHPTLIITDSQTHPFIVDQQSHLTHAATVITRTMSEFNYDAGRDRLASINLQSFTQHYFLLNSSLPDTKNALDAFIDGIVTLDGRLNKLMVGCAGALLLHMSNEGYEDIVSLNSFSLDSTMWVSPDTLFALSVFQHDYHPNVFKDTIRKEGLSLFAILSQHCSTPCGRQVLRKWLCCPSTNNLIVSTRLDAVQALVTNNLVRQSIKHSLKSIKNLPNRLQRMKQRLVLSKDWQIVVWFLQSCIQIRLILTPHTEVAYFNAIVDAVPDDMFHHLLSYINDIVDLDSTVGNAVIKPEVDEQLDALRDKYEHLNDILSDFASHRVVFNIPTENTSSFNVVYFPQLGYLIAIALDNNSVANDDDGDGQMSIQANSNLVFQFKSQTHLYFKNPDMFHLDTELGDIHSDIVERQIAINQQLLETVVAHTLDILGAFDLMCELDCLVSLAECAVQYKYCRPEMKQHEESSILWIEQGRHPILEHCVDTFIPNDTFLGKTNIQQFPNIMLITAANFSGKSIYLHQTALICIMAHIGSFVPAKSASLTYIDKLLTRIHTNDSTMQSRHSTTSSFVTDVKQVANALTNCTGRSLVLFDEFGKGTSSYDGFALYASILEHFHLKSATNTASPLVLATSHFHDLTPSSNINLFTQAEPTNIGYFTLRIRHELGDVSVADTVDSDSVTFLYEVSPISTNETEPSSLGIHCAKMAGMPYEVVKRSYQFQQTIQRGNPLYDVTTHGEASGGSCGSIAISDFDKMRLKAARIIVDRFLALDLQQSDEMQFELDTVWDMLRPFQNLFS